MSRRNFNDGQEIKYEDLNGITQAIERNLFDRVLFEMLEGVEDSFFKDGFYVEFDDSTHVNVKAGVGFQTDSGQSSPEPEKRPLYLASASNEAITTPDGSNDRIDIVCVKAALANEIQKTRKYKDAVSGEITPQSMWIQKIWEADIQIVAGTPAGSPTPPATPSGYLRIAQIYVTAASGIADQDAITDEREKFSLAGKYNVVVDSSGKGDYDTLADYVADSPKANDKLLIKTDETLTANLVLPDDITIRMLNGKKLSCSSDLSALLTIGSRVRIEGNLKLELSHTGVIVKAVQINGDDSVFENIIIDNTSTGIVTDGFYIESGKKANRGEGLAINSGAGSFTEVLEDNSGLDSNVCTIIERS